MIVRPEPEQPNSAPPSITDPCAELDRAPCRDPCAP